MQRKILLAAATIAVGTLSLAACSDSSSPRMGTLSVKLTDAPCPFDQVQRADVFVVRIDAKLADTNDEDAARDVSSSNDNTNPSRGWVTIGTPNASLNLLDLQGGKLADLGQQTLPVGNYRGFRLILDTQKSSVTLKDGTVLTGTSSPGIVWPSAGRTGIKIKLDKPFNVEEEGSLMVVDFDLGNSFVLRGATIQSNGLLFKPVVRASASEATGSISGTVRSSAAGTPPVVGASVQVLQPGTALTDTDPTKVVATTATDAAGAYKAAYLPAGSYSLRVYPPSGSTLKPTLVATVAVVAGQDTGASNVTLAP